MQGIYLNIIFCTCAFKAERVAHAREMRAQRRIQITNLLENAKNKILLPKIYLKIYTIMFLHYNEFRLYFKVFNYVRAGQEEE